MTYSNGNGKAGRFTKITAGIYESKCGRYRIENMVTGWGDKAWTVLEKQHVGYGCDDTHWVGVDTWPTLRAAKESLIPA